MPRSAASVPGRHPQVGLVPAAAYSALRDADAPSARRHLAAAPEELRGWEWRYLRAQLDVSAAVLAHPGPVHMVASRPGPGSPWMIATACEDGVVRLWDGDSGVMLRALHGHEGPVLSVTLSPDGHNLASGSADNTIRFWSIDTGRESARIDGVPDPHSGLAGVHSVVFSHDGARLCALYGVGGQQRMRCWNTASLEPCETCQPLERGAVGHVAFAPDGMRLAVVGLDYLVRLYDTGSLGQVGALDGPKWDIGALAWSGDGLRLVAGTSNKTLYLWDPTTHKLLTTFSGHAGRITDVSFSPDDRRIASASSDQTVRVWIEGRDQPLHTLLGHTDVVNSVTFSPDGTRLASAALDGSVRIWDLRRQDGEVLRGHEGYVYGVAFSPDGHNLASASWDRTVRLWDLKSGRHRIVAEDLADYALSVAFAPPDGSILAVGTSPFAGGVQLWDLGRSRNIGVLTTSSAHEIAFSRNGALMVTTGQKPDAILLFDASKQDLIRSIPAPVGLSWAGAVAISPDQTVAAVGGTTSVARLFETATGQPAGVLVGHEDTVDDLAFSPDGSRIATASWDATVRIWDRRTQRTLQILSGHNGRVFAVAFSPDGTRLASGSDDTTLRIWDPATGEELLQLRGHDNYIHDVAFSPDGSIIATASGDHTIRLWRSTSPLFGR